MTEIAAIQYHPVAGGWWKTAKQVMRSKDDDGRLEPSSDFMRRAEKERVFYESHWPDVKWRVE